MEPQFLVAYLCVVWLTWYGKRAVVFKRIEELVKKGDLESQR